MAQFSPESVAQFNRNSQLELGINPGSIIQLNIECNEIIIKAINNPPNQKQNVNHNI